MGSKHVSRGKGGGKVFPELYETGSRRNSFGGEFQTSEKLEARSQQLGDKAGLVIFTLKGILESGFLGKFLLRHLEDGFLRKLFTLNASWETSLGSYY